MLVHHVFAIVCVIRTILFLVTTSKSVWNVKSADFYTQRHTQFEYAVCGLWICEWNVGVDVFIKCGLKPNYNLLQALYSHLLKIKGFIPFLIPILMKTMKSKCSMLYFIYYFNAENTIDSNRRLPLNRHKELNIHLDLNHNYNGWNVYVFGCMWIVGIGFTMLNSLLNMYINHFPESGKQTNGQNG